MTTDAGISESLKESLLEKFDHIKEIIETAEACGFERVNAVPDTAVGECTIVGPTEEEFIEVAAKAIDCLETCDIRRGCLPNSYSDSVQRSRWRILYCGDTYLSSTMSCSSRSLRVMKTYLNGFRKQRRFGSWLIHEKRTWALGWKDLLYR